MDCTPRAHSWELSHVSHTDGREWVPEIAPAASRAAEAGSWMRRQNWDLNPGCGHPTGTLTEHRMPAPKHVTILNFE